MYRCLGLASKEDETRIPRFEYIDRVPDIIDIAGFTRISENSIKNVIEPFRAGGGRTGWPSRSLRRIREAVSAYVRGDVPGTVVNRAGEQGTAKGASYHLF